MYIILSRILEKQGSKKEFDSEPVYNQMFLKTKVKSYGDEVADFYNKEITKVDSNHTCLAVIILDSALKKNENYNQQVFLIHWKKLIRHIDDLESSCDDSDEE